MIPVIIVIALVIISAIAYSVCAIAGRADDRSEKWRIMDRINRFKVSDGLSVCPVCQIWLREEGSPEKYRLYCPICGLDTGIVDPGELEDAVKTAALEVMG